MKKETEQKLATALGQALEEDFKTIPKEKELKITMHTSNKSPNERPVIYKTEEKQDSLRI